MHICLILAEKIIKVLEESGATEVERLTAVDIARAMVPVSSASLHSKSQDQVISDGPGSA